MAFLIPTHAEAFYSQITQIDNLEYLLLFEYNSTDLCYRLSLSLTDGTSLADGVKLVLLRDLLAPLKHDPRVPQGVLFVNYRGADDSPPGLGDLAEGGRCQLLYRAP